MTVSTTTNRIAYVGNGATTDFPVPFAFFEDADLVIIERAVATGAEAIKTLATDYTVAGGNGDTGTVHAVSPPSSAVEWTIKRVLPRTQGMDLTPNDPFPSATVEESHDRAVMVVQEIEETVSRAIRIPQTDAGALSTELPPSNARALKYLAFDAAGQPIAAPGPTGTSNVPVSAFMETVLDDATAAAARTTLGLGSVATRNSGTAAGQAPLAEHVIGKQTVWIPAVAMVPRGSAGAATGIAESATNKIMKPTLDFDGSADEFAQFIIAMPKAWNEGTVSAKFLWTADTGAGAVVWGLQGTAISDDDALDSTLGTAQTVIDTLLAAGDLHQSPETSSVSVSGAPAAEDLVVFQVFRDADSAADTLSADARLLGVRLYFTTDTGVDA